MRYTSSSSRPPKWSHICLQGASRRTEKNIFTWCNKPTLFPPTFFFSARYVIYQYRTRQHTPEVSFWLAGGGGRRGGSFDGREIGCSVIHVYVLLLHWWGSIWYFLPILSFPFSQELGSPFILFFLAGPFWLVFYCQRRWYEELLEKRTESTQLMKMSCFFLLLLRYFYPVCFPIPIHRQNCERCADLIWSPDFGEWADLFVCIKRVVVLLN
jgi:hypothetical protein